MNLHHALSLLTVVGMLLAVPISQPAAEEAGANVIVISDEIWGRSSGVERPDADSGDPEPQRSRSGASEPQPDVTASRGGNDHNRSGLGDGTNPGQGAGRANATNEGTDNPNQAPAERGRRR